MAGLIQLCEHADAQPVPGLCIDRAAQCAAGQTQVLMHLLRYLDDSHGSINIRCACMVCIIAAIGRRCRRSGGNGLGRCGKGIATRAEVQPRAVLHSLASGLPVLASISMLFQGRSIHTSCSRDPHSAAGPGRIVALQRAAFALPVDADLIGFARIAPDFDLLAGSAPVGASSPT